jgi:hypothetical protein
LIELIAHQHIIEDCKEATTPASSSFVSGARTTTSTATRTPTNQQQRKTPAAARSRLLN